MEASRFENKYSNPKGEIFTRPYKIGNWKDKVNYLKISLLCRIFGKKTNLITVSGKPAISYRYGGYYHLRVLEWEKISQKLLKDRLRM